MKIKANKYTNIDLSVIGLSSYLYNVIKEAELVKYDDLQKRVISKKGKSARNNFQHALIFLFSVGKVEYHPLDDILSISKDNA